MVHTVCCQNRALFLIDYAKVGYRGRENMDWEGCGEAGRNKQALPGIGNACSMFLLK